MVPQAYRNLHHKRHFGSAIFAGLMVVCQEIDTYTDHTTSVATGQHLSIPCLQLGLKITSTFGGYLSHFPIVGDLHWWHDDVHRLTHELQRKLTQFLGPPLWEQQQLLWTCFLTPLHKYRLVLPHDGLHLQQGNRRYQFIAAHGGSVSRTTTVRTAMDVVDKLPHSAPQALPHDNNNNYGLLLFLWQRPGPLVTSDICF